MILGTTQPELLAHMPRVAVLDEGRLVAEGTLAEMRQTPEMRALLGA
ncbi:hypothetical protein MUN81_09435 [Hymenobacter sp. 5317J-9]|nr:hypothetical protein [Hymenobacter sp. 5317J-9]UOQ99700.1 hypothetical protein MUN81_09435 [Hymenobacter sp. 5317J-9]